MEKTFIPRELSISEKLEMSRLKRHLFKGETFVEFSEEEMESPEMVRYLELLKIKQMRLSWESQRTIVGNENPCYN